MVAIWTLSGFVFYLHYFSIELTFATAMLTFHVIDAVHYWMNSGVFVFYDYMDSRGFSFLFIS